MLEKGGDKFPRISGLGQEMSSRYECLIRLPEQTHLWVARMDDARRANGTGEGDIIDRISGAFTPRLVAEVHQYPRLVSSGHYLAEYDVFGVQLGANRFQVALVTRHSQNMCVADYRKLPLAAIGKLGNKIVVTASVPAKAWSQRYASPPQLKSKKVQV